MERGGAGEEHTVTYSIRLRASVYERYKKLPRHKRAKFRFILRSVAESLVERLEAEEKLGNPGSFVETVVLSLDLRQGDECSALQTENEVLRRKVEAYERAVELYKQDARRCEALRNLVFQLLTRRKDLKEFVEEARRIIVP